MSDETGADAVDMPENRSGVHVREYPGGALIVVCPAGTFTISHVGALGWKVQAYRPGDVTSAGTFVGHFPTRRAALSVLETPIELP